MEVTASFYDGKTSQRKEVRLHFDPSGRLRIIGLENYPTYALSEIRISSRVGNTPRSIYLPGGAKCETLDNDTIDRMLGLQRSGRWQAFLHKLESRLGYVLLLSLGLLIPWASIRMARYRLDNLQLLPADDLDGFIAAEQEKVGAAGEEILDFFDFDIGI